MFGRMSNDSIFINIFLCLFGALDVPFLNGPLSLSRIKKREGEEESLKREGI